MNNKEQLQKQAQKLQEELDKLKQQIEECDKEETDRVTKGADYFAISPIGELSKLLEEYSSYDDACYDIGNYFKTREEAGQHVKNLKTKIKLKRLAQRLNKGKNLIFNTYEQGCKYYLTYSFNDDKIYDCSANLLKAGSTIYCLDPEFKDVAIKEIGEQALIDYLKSEV